MSEGVTATAGETVEGVVDHILHVSFDESTVLRLATGGGEKEVTAVGKAVFGVRPGESLRLRGHWVRHARYGEQFRVDECERTMPADERAIRLYLASGMVGGIGPVLAGAIVDVFGADTLRVIDEEPDRLLDVYLIGAKRLRAIAAAWQQQKAIAEIMVFLQGLGITPALAVKIYTTYAETDDDPMEVVRTTPYRLSREVRGVGFVQADRIALTVGVPKHSGARLQAALLHVLDQAGRTGDCHLPAPVLLTRTRQLLTDDDPATADLVSTSVLRHALDLLREAGEVVTETLPVTDGSAVHPDTEIVMLPQWHYDETKLAEHLRRISAAPSLLAGLADWDAACAALTSQETAGLTDEQRQAVHTALTRPLSVLTGGPGCGKTHTLRTLVELADDVDAVVALAAPTGKAAKRLEETTGLAATTIHRLIKPALGDSLFDHAGLLETADLVVIDETSMLDLGLARRLAAAIRDGCHLLLVGDIDQLPSVGPGLVLRDLLAVEHVPRTRLTRVFRQDGTGSAIVTNAHRILRGQMPQDDPASFWLREMADAGTVAERVVHLVAELMPSHLGVLPSDIQVLCPRRKDVAGMIDLNLRLQERLNPPAGGKPEIYYEGIPFRLHDRVQQIRNNPHRGEGGIFNGSSGTISALDPESGNLTVTFTDGDEADYPLTELDELIHAYALTVHRSQGSEYPYVIVPMLSGAGIMLQRNLLYTAVTRARKGVMIIGHPDAVQRAVTTNRTERRRTALTHRILNGTAGRLPASRPQPPGQLRW
ncbi:ATP-dependent RecD-like DNA helicase [Spirillospora sp. NPDC047279]|uniref:SF1B family DNA helicase RecD2 n=1 Tax=Spirillospora sp. NPDC047279 TaxID=3155478 RepID=UPI0033F7FA47